ncbi:hypothetical protein [uncultured Veillonella sp.]|uniref:hypothetical protein n=1 Tax=uncultured Veillonella sp. TaxID=159268 RepID=UPI0028DC9ACD|nr:hypothetical protein [uncultured Veillonella sp.]
MRALNKKVMTLACATCLTVGMGAVACADTVDLGYGLYGTTSTNVKAVEMSHISSDETMRTRADNEILLKANENALATINEFLKKEYSAPVKPMTDLIVDGVSWYQLQGTNEQGHHVGYLISIDYSKSALDQVIGINQVVSEKGSGSDKAKIKRDTYKGITEYTKLTAQHQLSSLKGESLEGRKLEKSVKDINLKLPLALSDELNKVPLTSKGMSVEDQQELINILKFGVKQLQVDATHLSYKPVQTRYGTAVTGNARVAISYDGFKYPFSVTSFAIPTDKGVVLQFLWSEDSSHDYWANELNRMYQTQSLKGGK